jgi:RND superfamily putative drug exporter
MKNFLNQHVAVNASFWIILWVTILAVVMWFAPKFDSIVQTGEFGYLPEWTPTRQAEKIFKESFKKDLLGSLIVIVVKRENREKGLITDQEFQELNREKSVSDFEFIDQTLKPALESKIKEVMGEGLINESVNGPLLPKTVIPKEKGKEPVAPPASDRSATNPADDDNVLESDLLQVRTFSDPAIGALLTSPDNQSTLVTIELPNDFLDYRNAKLIENCEKLIFEDDEFKAKIPPGLQLSISGSATVGRDMNEANKSSAKNTEWLTVILVIVLLIWIYRAPILAFIPLIAVGISLKIAICIVALLAERNIIGAFAGMNVYMTVVTYGAGVDYCLFLIARYKELLSEGHPVEDAIYHALRNTTWPLVASAGTSILGIGSMCFANFGKFREAGIGISIGLIIALCASLTLAPAILRIFGRYAFWPKIFWERPSEHIRWWSHLNPFPKSWGSDSLDRLWHDMADRILKYPSQLWNYSVLAMLPFAIIAIIFFEHLSYGLLSELPQTSRSVIGTRAVQEHFPAGTTGPATVLLVNEKIDFQDDDSIKLIEEMTSHIQSRMKELGLADLRSISNPFGITPHAIANAEKNKARINAYVFAPRRIAEQGLYNKRILAHYVGSHGPLENHVTRIDLVFNSEPFSQESLKQLNAIQDAIKKAMPEALKEGTQTLLIGTTASIRDLKNVTDSDQIRIDLLVLIFVYGILVILLHQPATSMYLILSVFFSYLVTLGVTFTFFWAIDPMHFEGLDWKVRMFLFVILIAIGEDYNIFLISRYEEEKKIYGPVEGIRHALTKTGSVISSCGLIMAGTFGTLMAGSISGMIQLGFALAFGVLLDTFVIRPILVPCYLVMLHEGKFGALGKMIGSLHLHPHHHPVATEGDPMKPPTEPQA